MNYITSPNDFGSTKFSCIKLLTHLNTCILTKQSQVEGARSEIYKKLHKADKSQRAVDLFEMQLFFPI